MNVKKGNKYISILLISCLLKPNLSYLLGDTLGFWIPEILSWIVILFIMLKIGCLKIKRTINLYFFCMFIYINILAIALGLFKFNNVSLIDLIEVFRYTIYFVIYLIVINIEFDKSIIAINVVKINLINFILVTIQLFNFNLEKFIKYFYRINTDVSIFGSYKRVGGTLSNPNYLGIWCVMSVFIIIAYYEGKKSIKIVAILMSILMLFFTGSRTALLLFIISSIMYIVLHLSNRVSFKQIIQGFVLLAIFIIIGQTFIENIDKFARFKNIGQELVTLNNRTSIWNMAFEELNHNYIFGIGISKSSLNTFDNNYVEILVRYGLTGLGVFIIFLLHNLIGTFKKNRCIFIFNIVFIISMIATSTYRVLPIVILFIIVISDIENESVVKI